MVKQALDQLGKGRVPGDDERDSVRSQMLRRAWSGTAGPALCEARRLRKVLPMMGGMSGADIHGDLSDARGRRCTWAAEAVRPRW